jgi:hypothetical protein
MAKCAICGGRSRWFKGNAPTASGGITNLAPNPDRVAIIVGILPDVSAGVAAISIGDAVVRIDNASGLTLFTINNANSPYAIAIETHGQIVMSGLSIQNNAAVQVQVTEVFLRAEDDKLGSYEQLVGK